MRPTTWMLLVPALLAGCAGVFSKEPASDAATTRGDERVVGFWRVDSAATPDAAGDEKAARTLLVVGRAAADEPALRTLLITLRKDGTIEETAFPVSATTLGGTAHASLSLGSAAEPSWTVVRYEMPDADTLRILALDEHSVATDVRSGAVAGKASEWKDQKTGKTETAVTLDLPTPALRAYLKKRGDAVFRTSRPFVLRRVRMD